MVVDIDDLPIVGAWKPAFLLLEKAEQEPDQVVGGGCNVAVDIIVNMFCVGYGVSTNADIFSISGIMRPTTRGRAWSGRATQQGVP